MQTYGEVTQWLFSQTPVFQNQGATAYKPGLAKMQAFSARLGNPHQNYPSLHIAGTNGKGSTAHLLASSLQEMGYKVGLYTSPHLLDFSERIRVNGQVIAKEYVVDFVQEYHSFFLSEQLSFFEITVGMALAYFAQRQVDYAVIEVGLGGRLDATNIITPQLAVITNIGLDHTEFLGDSLAQIAYEKAGIIKENIPVVIGEIQKETLAVFKTQAKEKKAPLHFAEKTQLPEFPLDLMGSYQEKNKRTTYKALQVLFAEEELPQKAIDGFAKVIKNTGLRGRWELIDQHPEIVADVTHNTEGFKMVAQQLKEKKSEGELHLVLGFVKGKKMEAIFSLLPKNAHYYFCAPSIPRALAVEEVIIIAENHGLNARAFPSPANALEMARQVAKPKDFIYAGGSTFVVAEILS
ncbi:MAG: bifunctional folylpolyglutamate synthase/dihydrofolate synthase [Flavobacteriaceae bacterium]|nr:bifunctional folylpolyglutamate synthase/dihydrofolate synthase [Flavobacteriaceae bacterium]